MTDEHVKFDPRVVQEFADRLYRQADLMALSSAIVGSLIGITLGAVSASLIHQTTHMTMVLLAGALICGLLGYVRGRERGFSLKLNAQQALCQIHIERNSRLAVQSRRTPTDAELLQRTGT